MYSIKNIILYVDIYIVSNWISKVDVVKINNNKLTGLYFGHIQKLAK